MIKEETIKKFQKVVNESYERKITFEEAENILGGLVGYYDLLAKMYHQIKIGEEGKGNGEDNGKYVELK